MPFDGRYAEWPTAATPPARPVPQDSPSWGEPPLLPKTATTEDDFARKWQGVRLAVSHTENMSASELSARIAVVFDALGLK